MISNQVCSLPYEILDNVLSYLPVQERISLFPAVCKDWYALKPRFRYDSKELASQILKINSGSFSEIALIKLSQRSFLTDLENKLFKQLKFDSFDSPYPDKYRVKFNTNPPQEFQIFEYNSISNSHSFNIHYHPKKEQFKISQKPKDSWLRFFCNIEAHIFTKTAEMDHSGIPQGSTLIASNSIDEKFVIKDKIYFTHACSIKVEKATKFRKWKMIKLPEPYIEIMQNINSLISFHLTSFIETVSRYNLECLKAYNTIGDFEEKKEFFCNNRGRISTDSNGMYSFELYAKEVKWHDEKKIITLQWNDPHSSLRFSTGGFLSHLRHAVFSRTTEFLVDTLGLIDF